MEEDSLREEIDKLERRVSFLESELEMNYDDHRFRRRVQSIAPDDANVELRDGHFGQFARITNINGDEAQRMIGRFEGTEYETALTETSEGLGLEVFTEERSHGITVHNQKA